jgi:ribosomal protein S18 acetylase RimI-like enzyme
LVDLDRYELTDANPEEPDDVEAISGLHHRLLQWGLGGLGIEFLRKIVYSLLLRDGLVRAALFRVDGNPVGFVTYTTNAISFHRTALKRYLVQVAFVLAYSIMRTPGILLNLIKALRIVLSRRSETLILKDPLAEILAIGVLPEYGSKTSVEHIGLHVPTELVRHAARYFHRMGFCKIRLIVDRFNMPAILFYSFLGGRFERYRWGRDPMYEVWFDVSKLLE